MGVIIDIDANQGPTMRTVDDEYLRAVILHEVGHALGIHQHLHEPHNLMYPYMPEQDFVRELSYDDMSTIFSLYEFHPINQKSVEKFIGLRAVCRKLDVLSAKNSLTTKQEKS